MSVDCIDKRADQIDLLEGEEKLSNEAEKRFKSLFLRRLVRENHGGTIHQCGFVPKPKGTKILNPHLGLFEEKVCNNGSFLTGKEEDSSNILCTVGGNQLNTYDSMHCGDHLDLVSHFTFDIEGNGNGNSIGKGGAENAEGEENSAITQKNNRSRKRSEEELTCFCWPSMRGELMVCCSGTTGIIHVISLTRSKEINRIYAHEGHVVSLCTYPSKKHLIASISTDGYISIWDLIKVEKKLSYPFSNGSYADDGSAIIAGTNDGHVTEIRIDLEDLEKTSYIYDIKTFKSVIITGRFPDSNNINENCAIDCLRSANEILVSKSVLGIIAVWNIESKQLIRKIRVENYYSYLKSQFDISPCARYCTVANPGGYLYVYDLQSGKKISRSYYSRCAKAIHCVAFDHNYKCIICAGEDSFIWRFNYADQNAEEKNS